MKFIRTYLSKNVIKISLFSVIIAIVYYFISGAIIVIKCRNEPEFKEARAYLVENWDGEVNGKVEDVISIDTKDPEEKKLLKASKIHSECINDWKLF